MIVLNIIWALFHLRDTEHKWSVCIGGWMVSKVLKSSVKAAIRKCKTRKTAFPAEIRVNAEM